MFSKTSPRDPSLDGRIAEPGVTSRLISPDPFLLSLLIDIEGGPGIGQGDKFNSKDWLLPDASRKVIK